MNYITTAKAAEKWGVSSSLVLKLAQSGRIPGTVQIGTRWMIPSDADKPTDGRTRAAKLEKEQESEEYRYPAFEGKEASSFSPPLCDEELKIKQAIEMIYACRFREAGRELRVLTDLISHTTNSCRRATALRLACMLCIFTNDKNIFLNCYEQLTSMMQEDFPRKPEIQQMLYELNATLGETQYYQEHFEILPGYAYHESYLPHLAALNAVSFFYSGKSVSPALLRGFELNCALVDTTDNYADRQTLHLYLGFAYYTLQKHKEANIHLRHALKLAEKYELYYCIATEYYFIEDAFKTVLNDFSEQFRDRLRACASGIHEHYVSFMETLSMNSIFALMLHKEYIYVIYAAQGLTNKEVSERMHISAVTVAKRYSEIYALLGVKNKGELVKLYRATVTNENNDSTVV